MPYWKINVNNVHTSRQSGEYFLTYSLWKMQSDAELRFNAALLRACKKKKVQPLGLDSQIMANKAATTIICGFVIVVVVVFESHFAFLTFTWTKTSFA